MNGQPMDVHGDTMIVLTSTRGPSPISASRSRAWWWMTRSIPNWRAKFCYPKGPCTQIIDTLAPKYPNRDYFKANVYTIWAHGSPAVVLQPTLVVVFVIILRPVLLPYDVILQARPTQKL